MKLIYVLFTVISVSFCLPTSKKVSNEVTLTKILKNKNRFENDLPKFLLINDSTSALESDIILNAEDSEENEVTNEVLKITDSELMELKDNVTAEVFESIKFALNVRMINASSSLNQNNNTREVALMSLINNAFKKVMKFVNGNSENNDLINADVDSSNVTIDKLTRNFNELSTSKEDDNSDNKNDVLDSSAIDRKNIEIAQIEGVGSNENMLTHSNPNVDDDIVRQVIVFDNLATTFSNDTNEKIPDSQTNELLSNIEIDINEKENGVFDSSDNNDRENTVITQITEDIGSSEDMLMDNNSIEDDNINKQVIVFDNLLTTFSNDTIENISDSQTNELLSSIENDNNEKEIGVFDSSDSNDRENTEITQINEDIGSSEDMQMDNNSIEDDNVNKQVIVFDNLSTTFSNNTDELNPGSPASHDREVVKLEDSTDGISTASNDEGASTLSTDTNRNEEEEQKPVDYEFELTTESFDKIEDTVNGNNDNGDNIEVEETTSIVPEISTQMVDKDIVAEVEDFTEHQNDVDNDQDNEIKKDKQSEIDKIRETTSGRQIDEQADILSSFITVTTRSTDEHSTEEMHDVFISLLEDAKDYTATLAPREDDIGTPSVASIDSHSTNNDILESSEDPNNSSIDEEILEDSAKISNDSLQNESNYHLGLITVQPVKDKAEVQENETEQVSRKEKERQDENVFQKFTSHQNNPLDITPPAANHIQVEILGAEDGIDAETKRQTTENFDVELTTLRFLKDANYENGNEEKSSNRQEQLNVVNAREVDYAVGNDDFQINNVSEQDTLTQVTSGHEFLINKSNVPSSIDEETVTESLVVEDKSPIDLNDDEVSYNEIIKNEKQFKIQDDEIKDNSDPHRLNNENNATDDIRSDEQMTNDSDIFNPPNIPKSVISGHDDVNTAVNLSQMDVESATDENKDTQEDSLSYEKQHADEIRSLKNITNTIDNAEVVAPVQETYKTNPEITNNLDLNLGKNTNAFDNVNEVENVHRYDITTKKLMETSDNENESETEQRSNINNQVASTSSNKLEATETHSVRNDETNERFSVVESTTQVDENDVTEEGTLDAYDVSEKEILESNTEKTVNSELSSGDNIFNIYEDIHHQMVQETITETMEEEHNVNLDKELDNIIQFKEDKEVKKKNLDEQIKKENSNLSHLSDPKNEIDNIFENKNDNKLKAESKDSHRETESLEEKKYSTINPGLYVFSNEEINGKEIIKSDPKVIGSKSKTFENNDKVGHLLDSTNRNELIENETLTNDNESQIATIENIIDETLLSSKVVSALLEVFNNVLKNYNVTLPDDGSPKPKVQLSNERKSSKSRISNKVRKLEPSSEPIKLQPNEDNTKSNTERIKKDGKNKYVIIDIGKMLTTSMESKTPKSSLQSKDDIPELKEIMEFESTRINEYKENANKESKVAFIPIVKQLRTFNSNGEYSFMFETADGTYRSETGKRLKNIDGVLSQEGEYSFLLPNGERFNLKYIANEAGFQPESDYIPRPHRPIQSQPQRTKRGKQNKRKLRPRKL